MGVASREGAGASLATIDGFPARHAFTLRHPGRSTGPYAGLNLGDAVGDAPERVAANRMLVGEALRAERRRLRLLRQVHGDRIVAWSDPGLGAAGVPEADAHLSDDPRDVLAISVADCLPLLFWDPVTGAAGAAHCGWRGTAIALPGQVVRAMADRFGARASDLAVGIGPGIGGDCYQVGAEVVATFRGAGFPAEIARPDDEGRFRLDLRVAAVHALRTAGVLADHIWIDDSCTHCDAARFFSYRRDGTTGRHWAIVRPGSRRTGAADTMPHGASPGDHAAPAGA